MEKVIKKSRQGTKEVKVMKNDLGEMVERAEILTSDEQIKLSELANKLRANQKQLDNQRRGNRRIVINNLDDVFSFIGDSNNEEENRLSINEILNTLKTEYDNFSTTTSRDKFIKEIYNFSHEHKDKESVILMTKLLFVFGYIKESVFDEINNSINPMTKGNSNYTKIIETIASIPFGIIKETKSNIKEIEAQMDLKIYGMKKIKENILNCLTVNKYSTKKINTPILLYGASGVGKTVFAEVLAEVLGLPFYKINFSSAYDRSFMKGANRTWNSSDIGEITRILIKAKCMNPVILFDEIDKAGGSSAGKSVDTVTEILDPEQRCFKDDYLTVTYDLSSAYIICTANDLEFVPPHIIDRCHKIEIQGYKKEELFHITKYYLPNQLVKEYGLQYELILDDTVVNKLIKVKSLRSIKRMIMDVVGWQLRNGVNIQKNKIIINDIKADIFYEYCAEVQKPAIGFGR